MRTFLILARYASRTVYDEAKDALASSSLFWPPTLARWLRAWLRHVRVECQLGGYETYLWARAKLGLRMVQVQDSFRE
jgi:aarF domain-containing kinase